jgi:hypothetical protein
MINVTWNQGCQHLWAEDVNYSSRAFSFSGSSADLKKEARVVCVKCKEARYVPKKSLGSLLYFINELA